MKRLFLIGCLTICCTFTACAQDVLELVSTLRNGRSCKVDFLANGDSALGVFGEVRFSSWGRGKGEQWFALEIEDLVELRRRTREAIQTPSVAAPKLGRQTISVRVVGGTVVWYYLQSESGHRVDFVMSVSQAKAACVAVDQLLERLEQLAKIRRR